MGLHDRLEELARRWCEKVRFRMLAFGIAIVYDQLDSTLNVSTASWWQLPVTIVQNGVYLVLVLLVARRMGLRSTTAPPARVPAGQPTGYPAG